MRGGVLPLGILLLASCGPSEPHLEGSLTEVVDLVYRTADLHQSDADLALRFVAPQGAGENVVLRLTVGTVGISVDANEPIDLAAEDDLGRLRGAVTRNVVDDPLQTFPPVGRGALTFEKSLQPGQTVRGTLNITFAQGTELASGRTVFGTFEALVQ